MEESITTSKKLTKRERFLVVAEIFDAYRVVPRAILAMYGVLVYKLYTWIITLGTVVKTQCDAALIKILLDSGVDIAQAQEIACTVAEVVGGPTTAQTAFVTTVIGLATPLFAFYANTGKVWGKKED